MATLATRISVPGEVLFRDLGDEMVLLDLESGRYFGLNEIATRMWALLLRHGRVAPALDDLLEEYEVGEDRLQTDLFGFVDALASQGLLRLDES